MSKKWIIISNYKFAWATKNPEKCEVYSEVKMFSPSSLILYEIVLPTALFKDPTTTSKWTLKCKKSECYSFEISFNLRKRTVT